MEHAQGSPRQMKALHWPHQPKSRLSQRDTVPLGAIPDNEPLRVSGGNGAARTCSDTSGSFVNSKLRSV